jgi:hypothetical protein
MIRRAPGPRDRNGVTIQVSFQLPFTHHGHERRSVLHGK